MMPMLKLLSLHVQHLKWGVDMDHHYFKHAKDCLKKSIVKISLKDGTYDVYSILLRAFELEFIYPNLPRGGYYSNDDIMNYRWDLMRVVCFYLNCNGCADGVSKYVDLKCLDKNKLINAMVTKFTDKYFQDPLKKVDNCYFTMLLITDSPMPHILDKLEGLEFRNRLLNSFADLFESLAKRNVESAVDLTELIELVPSLIKCYTSIYKTEAPYIDVETDKLMIECSSIGAKRYVETLNTLVSKLVEAINEKVLVQIDSSQLCETIWHQFVDSHAFELGVHFIAQINQHVNDIYLSKIELDSRERIYSFA